MASRLDDAQHGSMIGQRDEERDGHSGSVEAITSFVCHHLKSMYIRENGVLVFSRIQVEFE